MPPLLASAALQGAMGAFGGGGSNPQLPTSSATAKLEDSHDIFAGFKQGALEAARTVNQNPTFGASPFISNSATGVNWTMISIIGAVALIVIKFIAR